MIAKKSIFLILIFTFSLFAKESIFLMPKEANQGKSALLKAFNDAQKSIDIAIYSFTHKQIANAIKNAAKRGVNVTIITDRKGAYERNRTGYLAKYKNIDAYTVQGKRARSNKYNGIMHLKLAIIDGKRVVHGSANWSYSAFGLNHEVLIIDDNIDFAKKMSSYYKELLTMAKEF